MTTTLKSPFGKTFHVEIGSETIAVVPNDEETGIRLPADKFLKITIGISGKSEETLTPADGSKVFKQKLSEMAILPTIEVKPLKFDENYTPAKATADLNELKKILKWLETDKAYFLKEAGFDFDDDTDAA